jgi:ferrous iron transport protein B
MACHAAPASIPASGETVALVGQPNVGKSALFHRLTGRYVAVSNYPGTTVNVSRGAANYAPQGIVVDTPGLIGLPSSSEDEQLTVQILLTEKLAAVVHVGDAKNLRRTLNLAVQLAETGLPMVLAMNMQDEAAARGVLFEASELADRLGISVVPTVAVRGDGLDDLQRAIAVARPSPLQVRYPEAVESELGSFHPELPASSMSPRALGLLWMIGDAVVESWLRDQLKDEAFERLAERRRRLEASLGEPIGDAICRRRLEVVEALLAQAEPSSSPAPVRFADRLARAAIHPVWGLAILAVVLLAVYFFVGSPAPGLSAAEGRLFGHHQPVVAARWRVFLPVPFLVKCSSENTVCGRWG